MLENQSLNRDESVVKSGIVNAFMRGVYYWMTAGLLVTAAVSWFAANSYAFMKLSYENRMVPIVLAVGVFGLSIYLNARIHKLSAGAATGLFLLFSGLMGLLLAPIFIVYTQSSIFTTFLVCAGMFGGMSVYGLVTKRDLTGWRSFLVMGVIGLLILMIVNIFTYSGTLNLLIGFLGVIIFAGLTAYDSQKLKQMGMSAPTNDPTALRRGTILGALTLYLDFINLFLMLLRIIGDRR